MEYPMTTDQAVTRFNVRKPTDIDEIVDNTCSVVCRNCDKTVWFIGNLEDHKQVYKCPYCNLAQINTLLG